jgi:hypothetical protein
VGAVTRDLERKFHNSQLREADARRRYVEEYAASNRGVYEG